MSFMVLRGIDNEALFFDSLDEAISVAKEEAKYIFEEEGYLGQCVVYEAAMVAVVNYKPHFEVETLDPHPEP